MVATDLSTRAGPALVRGAALAQQQGAEVHLVHVTPQFSLKEMSESYRPYRISVEDQTRWVDASRAQLHALANSVSAKFGVVIHEHALLGSAASEIDTLARSLPADLLVVGAHGEGFLRELLLGSTAFALAQRVVCPSLIVKMPGERAYRNVLVGIDLMGVGRRALAAAGRVAPDATTTALHAVRIPFESALGGFSGEPSDLEQGRRQVLEEGRRQLEDFVGGSGEARRTTRVVAYGHAANVVVSQAQASQTDLVVVGRHAASLGTVRFGGVAKRIVEAVDCDVLIVP